MSNKSFAFKLAEKRPAGSGKWQARDGVSLAACTEVAMGQWRSGSNYSGQFVGHDKGYYC
jgi:hypothetical protein